MEQHDKRIFADMCFSLMEQLDQTITVRKHMKALADFPDIDEHPPFVVTLFVQAKDWQHKNDSDSYNIVGKGMVNKLLLERLTMLVANGDAIAGKSVEYYHPDHHPNSALFMFVSTDTGAATPPEGQRIPDPEPKYLVRPIHAPTGSHLPFWGDKFLEAISHEKQTWKTKTKHEATLQHRETFLRQVGSAIPTVVEVDLYMQIAPDVQRPEVHVSVNQSKAHLKTLAGHGVGARPALIAGALFKLTIQENTHENYEPPKHIHNIDPDASPSYSSPSSGNNSQPGSNRTSPAPGTGGHGPSTKRGRSASSNSGNDMGKGKGNSGSTSGGTKKKTKS